MKRLALLLFISITMSFLRAEEGGYTDKLSFTEGDDISFFISTKKASYSITIYNLADTINYVAQYTNLTGGERVTPDSSYYYGCSWPLTLKISSANFPPGVYRAEFMTSRGLFKVVFFVKPIVSGSISKILVVPSTNTWQAYNPFGGKSLYEFNSTDSIRAKKVSFLRPSSQIIGYPEFIRNEELIMRWLNKSNIAVEYGVDYDIHSITNLLSNYKVVIIAGHSEYWSYQQRYQLQKFVNQGGKLIILSGNTCWFQVRYENNGTTMVCYKDNTDPLYGIADSLVTKSWAMAPINNPENKLIGVGFLAGGYVNNKSRLPASQGYGDYAALDTWYWVYRNTGLHEGDEYGYQESIVGNETDGALYNWQNGKLKVTGDDGTPLNYRVLALSPANSDFNFTDNPHALMGIYYKSNGAAVFNTATINWENGLRDNFEIQQITLNVLNQFLKNTFPPEINSFSPYNITNQVINNETIPVVNRNYFSSASNNYNLKVSALKSAGSSLNFQWHYEGQVLGTDSTLSFTYEGLSAPKKATELKCYVFNQTDTSSVSWQFFNSELAFYSSPIRHLNAGKVYIKLPVFNLNHNPVQYIYSGPSWLSVDANGILNGVIPANAGFFTFTVIVTNGQISDTLVYSSNITSSNEYLSVPGDFYLSQNYPNPFNPSTVISYRLPAASQVSLKVYDILGEEIITLVNEFQQAGSYKVTFNKTPGLASGVYFYRLTAGVFTNTKKLILQQ